MDSPLTVPRPSLRDRECTPSSLYSPANGSCRSLLCLYPNNSPSSNASPIQIQGIFDFARNATLRPDPAPRLSLGWPFSQAAVGKLVKSDFFIILNPQPFPPAHHTPSFLPASRPQGLPPFSVQASAQDQNPHSSHAQAKIPSLVITLTRT